jgi:hypothetical protein
MTVHKVMTGVTDDVPQWSQPSISRLATLITNGIGNGYRPQWSRPRRTE